MFLKVTTPNIRDTVIINDAVGNELTRFVAIWQRPDTAQRKALLDSRFESLQRIQDAQAVATETGSLTGFTDLLQAANDTTRQHIRQYLVGTEGLLDADNKLIPYSSEVVDELLRWNEYTIPLAESLARVTDGKAIEESLAKNSVELVSSGHDSDALAV